MASVTFVGTGEAFDPELPNTSVLYRGERNLLVDCGYAVPHAFWRVSRDPSLLDAVYVTHLHADHSFGVPALLLWMRLAGRREPLTVFGGPGVERWLERLLDLAYPGSYEVEKCFRIEPVEITPGARHAFGAATLSNAESDHIVRNVSLRIDEGGKSVCVSGDGAPSEQTRILYRGCNLLVHECYSPSSPPKGHAGAEELLGMADELGIETLCLVHLGCDEKDAVRASAERFRGRTRVLVPSPGDVVAVE